MINIQPISERIGMNTISTGLAPPIPNNRQNTNSASTVPAEKPKEVTNDELRQGIVSVVETKQQKELVENFAKATANANQSNDSGNNTDLGDLQDIAQFARRVQVVQVIDDNDGSKIKEVAENRRDKIENLFREINTPEEVSTGQEIDSLA